jgi:hypothetical protein
MNIWVSVINVSDVTSAKMKSSSTPKTFHKGSRVEKKEWGTVYICTPDSNVAYRASAWRDMNILQVRPSEFKLVHLLFKAMFPLGTNKNIKARAPRRTASEGDMDGYGGSE